MVKAKAKDGNDIDKICARDFWKGRDNEPINILFSIFIFYFQLIRLLETCIYSKYKRG